MIPTAIVAQAGRRRVYLPATREVVPSTDTTSLDIGDLEVELAPNPRDVWCRNFGLTRPIDLFTNRQLDLLTTLSDLVTRVRDKVAADARGLDDGSAYADGIATYLGMAVSKLADYNSAMVVWSPGRSQAKSTFARQALPMVWDFVEVNPFAGAAGDLTVTLRGMCQVLETCPPRAIAGIVEQRDAARNVGDNIACFATDPPYYNNIAYADLSDFFYVWLRRSLRKIYQPLLSTVLVPKADELVAKAYRFNGDTSQSRLFFETGLGRAFERIRERQDEDSPFTVFYAFKQSETDEDDDETDELQEVPDNPTRTSTGWETMLEGVIKAKFTITGTWPMRSERGSRSVAIGTNALASSIVLVCRPRAADAPLATRKEFMNSLRQELPQALRNLQHGNIAPVDLAQASIGPGMAVFTRCSKVIESDGTAMSVRTALGLINQALDEVLAEQEGEFDTRWAIAWFDQFAHGEGPFGTAETLSKAKNVGVDGLREAGIVEARAGKVRLLKREELAEDWNPATDGRITVWEVTQYLIRALEQQGETGAADLLRKVGGLGEVARDLAYRLYTTCERRKWSQEAIGYNSLVIAWPEIARLSRQPSSALKQTTMLE